MPIIANLRRPGLRGPQRPAPRGATVDGHPFCDGRATGNMVIAAEQDEEGVGPMAGITNPSPTYGRVSMNDQGRLEVVSPRRCGGAGDFGRGRTGSDHRVPAG